MGERRRGREREREKRKRTSNYGWKSWLLPVILLT
jgi:hypothetical protein